MSKLDQATLYARYPKIFANVNPGPDQSCMFWGIECGDGWMDLIDTLCSDIQNHCDQQSALGLEIQQVTADQIKEKFGTLRFYTSGGDDVTYSMISQAELKSSHICETCGAPGQLRGRGWYYTACDAHTQPEDLAHKPVEYTV